MLIDGDTPDDEIDNVVDEPKPPWFFETEGEENHAAEVDAVGGGVKEDELLVGDKIEKQPNDDAANDTGYSDDDGSFEGKGAGFDVFVLVEVVAPRKESVDLQGCKDKSIENSDTVEIVF